MEDKQKVVVLDYASFENLSYEREVLEESNIEVVDGTSENMNVLEELEDADGVMVEEGEVDADLISKMDDCKIISIYATGHDNVDIEAATSRNIYVTTGGDYCCEQVANHTISLILASVRKILFYSRIVKSKNWDDLLDEPISNLMDLKELGEPISSIESQTLGLIGSGRIGGRVADKAIDLGFDVKVYDPYADEERLRDLGVKIASFEDVLEGSDVISIHVPLNEETRHMISDEEFDRMKNDCILVNTCRGAVIDEDALVKALKSNKIQAAALDVLEEEYPPRKDNPLLEFEDIIITPHVAFYSEESQMELRKRATNQVLQALEGKVPDNLVNKELVN